MRHPSNRYFPLGIALLLLFVSGCSLVDPGGVDACTDEGALFFDNFSGEQICGWREYSEGGATVEIVNDVLQISSGQPGQFWWTNPGREFGDVVIVTQARQTGGPDDNAYGVICRYQSVENFYIFLISGDGYYAIAKYQTGSDQVIYLTESGQYVYSDAINQGIATNEIQASCIGNELSMAVNGIPLTTVTDDAFSTGDIGLGLSTFQPGTAVVQFDNVRVLAP